MTEKKTVCVDLDGVLARYDGWKGIEHIGEVVPGVREFMDKLGEKYKVYILTSRIVRKDSPTEIDWVALGIVEAWLEANDIAYDGVYIGIGKPQAVAYIDDRAVNAGFVDIQNGFKEMPDLYWEYVMEDVVNLENDIKGPFEPPDGGAASVKAA